MTRNQLSTPVFVVDEKKLVQNLEILKRVQERCGCKILLAQKAFSCFYEYPLIGKYLAGTTASGLYEAKLGFEEMGKENHVFSPAYGDEEIRELDQICDHIIFNSLSQWQLHKDKLTNASIGLRINPECSTQEGHEIYDPCAPGSRLGITLEVLKDYCENTQAGKMTLPGVDGLHFHTLCEQNADDLVTTLAAVEEKFAPWLRQMKWINFGGGHHITRPDYDIEALEKAILHIKNTYDVEVYLEPGEAVALNAGFLVTTILDKVKNKDLEILILDTSAACHMPDVLEMPYRPPLQDPTEPEAMAGEKHEKPHTYRLSSRTCLAGDVIGDYSFARELQIGDRLTFEDMAIYSMVKTNTFNGMALPDIAVEQEDGQCQVIKSFGYEDFKGRLS